MNLYNLSQHSIPSPDEKRDKYIGICMLKLCWVNLYHLSQHSITSSDENREGREGGGITHYYKRKLRSVVRLIATNVS